MVENTSIKTEEENRIWQILGTVCDPEIPVLSVIDLGIVRGIKFIPGSPFEDRGLEITITPTYSGCPAMEMITFNIRMALLENGFNLSLIHI